MVSFNLGDILLYEAKSIKLSNTFPELIRLITGNKVIHVAIYLGYTANGHIILEALSDGVNIKALNNTEIYNRTNGFTLYGIARLPELVVDLNNTIFMIAAAKYNKSPYGYLTILNLLFQHGKTRLFPSKKWSVWFKSKKGYICSEISQLIYEDLGYKFPKLACLTEPDDYLSNPWQIKILKNS